MSLEKLRIIPLGGLGEIGMNCLVLEYEKERILIDCGIQFPDSSYHGVELLTPDFSYLTQSGKKKLSIVITHGHDDHIGAIPFLLRDVELDIYCTPFPKGLIELRLAEHYNLKQIRFFQMKPLETFSIGSFSFEPIPVQHSIIESVALGIQSPVGNLIHTGDFKHDEQEMVRGKKIGFEPFERWATKGVSLLLSDSTNAERSGHTLSEIDIAKSFERIFTEQKGRILIALFASNIRRIERLLVLAHKLGKKIALVGRSMHSYTRLAFEQASLTIPEDTLVLVENIHQFPDNNVIILITGSQAEPRSALVRVSQGIFQSLEIKPGDQILLSSRFIPGNERNITRMIDELYRLGADVIYESIHQIHVSGHGFQEELLMMLNATKPKHFIPVHGEYRHLIKHARLAATTGVNSKNIHVVEDGQVVELDKAGMRLAERLTLNKGIVVDGHFMQGSKEIFDDRNRLAKTGVVLVVLPLNQRDELIEAPRVVTRGLLFKRGVKPQGVLDDAVQMLEMLCQSDYGDKDLLDLVQLETRRHFGKWVSHKPMVILVTV